MLMESLLVLFMMLLGIGNGVMLPVHEEKQYEAGYTGDVSGNVHYNIMIVDDVNTQTVVNALQYVPNMFEFTIVKPDNSLYIIETLGPYAGMHLPTCDDYIVVYDGDKYPECQAGGMAWFAGNGHRIGIAVYDRDSEVIIGNRIFHEVIHAQQGNGTADNMTFNLDYMCANQTTFEQFAYYEYLLDTVRTGD